jgi:secondary thiamine-phosphate synthase enzyme
MNPMKTSTQSLDQAVAEDVMTFRRALPLTVVGHVLHYCTRQNLEFVNLTEFVEERVRKSGIQDGMALVQSLHSTTALFLNEWQDALLDDVRSLLEQAVRADLPWRHNDPRYSDCERGNAVSHLRTLLLGTSALLPVCCGRLMRGTWQSIILVELDGPRRRSVALQILGA